jgi:RNA polymerase sigma-70 factor (ECF subfamily)
MRAVLLLKEARERSDAGLVEECRNGEGSAFDELVRRYKDRVYNVAYRLLGHREDALDVSQEVFVRAYGAIKEFRGEARLSTWLHSIACNLARNRLRDGSRKGRDRGISLEALDVAAPDVARAASATYDTPRDAAERREMDELLQRCLNELPEHCRTVFVLRTFDNLSYEEIAETVGCPAGTVKSRLNQARRLLRERLHALDVM